MRTHEIENWALNVVDKVNAAQPNEDSRVELKASWIDPYKAARRIAGHANAARGEPILWLIGVDEKTGVIGANLMDLASWYAQVESNFDGLAPPVTPVNVPMVKETVVALLFATERAPFVVKVEGTDRLEVPWRGSTSIRSARRDELLRLLSPLQREPSLEVLSGSLFVRDGRIKGELRFDWQLSLMIYIVPGDSNRLVLPYHSCNCVLSFPEANMTFELSKVWMEPWDNRSQTLAITTSELLAEGPGMFMYRVIEKTPNEGVTPLTDAHVRLALHFVGAEYPTVVETIIPPLPHNPCHWASGYFKEQAMLKRDSHGEIVE